MPEEILPIDITLTDDFKNATLEQRVAITVRWATDCIGSIVCILERKGIVTLDEFREEMKAQYEIAQEARRASEEA